MIRLRVMSLRKLQLNATDSFYVQKICAIIEKYGLTRFDGVKVEKKVWYRVRKDWKDARSQAGAFQVLDNAKKCADEHPGFSVFDENGNLELKVEHNEGDFSFDEIGSVLKIKELQNTKEELFKSLEMFYKVFYLGEEMEEETEE